MMNKMLFLALALVVALPVFAGWPPSEDQVKISLMDQPCWPPSE